MERIMIIGCCGAGKSTFARKLAQITQLRLVHLDQQFWKPNWEETGKAEWKAIVTNLAAGQKWIIDGNYGGTIDIRIQRADTIIFLDYPTFKCLWRITKRIWKYNGRERPDMPQGCKERFNLEFYHYVATFNLTRRKKLMEKLNRVSANKKIVIFRNDIESDRFLEELNTSFTKA